MPDPFHASYSGVVRQQLQRLTERARATGIAAQYLAALRAIDERLSTDPLTFGEPRFHLHELKLAVRVGVILPIVVTYAVHEEQRLVFPRDFRLLE